jgi:hypothetical protein
MIGLLSLLRPSAFGLRTSLLLPALLLPLLACAQRPVDPRTPPLSPEESLKAGRQLVDELLAQKPEANSTNTGMVRIRDANDQERHIPVKFEIYSTPTNWVSIYQTFPADGAPAEELTVIHSGAQPSDYFRARRPASSSAAARPVRLTADQIMAPFAGSDFWVADLGLEFLHWPTQRVLRREQRRSQSCAVLESVNPHPAAGGYSRVDSWVDTDNGGILHADAYDARRQLIKEFDPTALKKVNGQRQLEEMEMRNRKTGSHTWIKFNLAEQR